MKTKNFETFLNEDYTELEAPAEEVTDTSEEPATPAEGSEMPTDDVSAPAEAAPSELPAPVVGMDSASPKSSKAIYIYGGVDSLNTQESALLQAMNQLTSALDCCEADVVKLYQLNIQPASSDGAAEPADGMSFIYEKLNVADVVVFVSPVQDGDVSSLTQTVLKRLASHYKNMELKNKIYAALLMGDQNSQQAVKADLSNQANNLGLIVAAGTTIFDIAQLQTLVQAIKEIKDATTNIRSVAPVQTAVPGVMNFDQFATNQGAASTDLATTSKVETDVEKGDSFDVVSDTDNTAPEGEETEGEETEGEADEAGDEAPTAEPAEGEESSEEPTSEEEGGELSEEEELSRKQKHLPKPLLKAILKSKHLKPEEEGLSKKDLEEEEEIEEIENPTLEAKNENTSMKKVHVIARFSDMKTDKTKNDFIMKVDSKKMPGGSVNAAPALKKEVAPDQKLEKGDKETSKEIKPSPDSSKMKSGAVNPTAGAKSLGKEENGDEKAAKGEKKKSVENFSNFIKNAK